MVFGLLTRKHHSLLFAKITAAHTIVTKYTKHNLTHTATVPFIFTKKNSKQPFSQVTQEWTEKELKTELLKNG